MPIVIDYSRDSRLSDHAVQLLNKHYLRPGEGPQDGFARAAAAWSGNDPALAQRLYDAASKGWMMFASPVLSNAPLPGETIKSLPISCFLGYVDDSIEGLNEHTVESRWLSVMGGGVGGHWPHVRSVSDVAPGPIPFLHTMDADMGAYLQGKVRRGSYAAYLDVSHPDVEEFLQIRVPTGDQKRKCLGVGFHHALNISDKFMHAVLRDGSWPLIDPNDGTERSPSGNGGKRLRARQLWEMILETRFRTGEPYLCFIDTANRGLPAALKNAGLHIHGSNLCSEIMLPTSAERTAVCCLSSLNLETYDEWKDTNLVADLVTMLDNVLTYFIERAPKTLWRAVRSAEGERSIGLGYMGLHAYLQKLDLPFESQEAIQVGAKIAKSVFDQAKSQSRYLAIVRGDPPDMHGTGERNAHVIAIAPNANSAIIAGTSASIELAAANAYTQRTRVGSHLVKNRYLEQVLDRYGQNTDEVWSSIILTLGSVQHLDFLTDHERAVFRTAREIDQMWVIRHAAERQPFIDQGQSLNLFFGAGADKAQVGRVHMEAWRTGLKALYYLHARASVETDAVGSKLERVKLQDFEPTPAPESTECVACQG